MKFGPVPPGEAKGGIVVHSIRKGGLVLRKGTVVGDAEIAALKASSNLTAAEAFVTSAVSGAIQEELLSAGFLPPPAS